MSIWWLSDICRDKPTSNAFCIGKTPPSAPAGGVSQTLPAVGAEGSPKPAAESVQQEPCQRKNLQ
jgi:hypothetical protein